MSATVNPVGQRLLYLCELWSQFVATDGKRLLLWQAHAQADAELAKLVAAAPPPFNVAFQLGRELLGKEWPLDNATALPAYVKEGTAA